MQAELSKVTTNSCDSLPLTNCKQQGDERLTTFKYIWGELLVQSCSTTAKQCRNKLKIDLFSLQLANKKSQIQMCD